MEVIDHLKATLIAAPALALIWNPGASTSEFFIVALAGLFAGVLVDLDHFPIYRLERGDWRDLKRMFQNPLKTMKNNSSVLLTFSPKKKYAAHAVSMMLISATTFVVYRSAFPVVLGCLIIHIVMDLVHSKREAEFPFSRDS